MKIDPVERREATEAHETTESGSVYCGNEEMRERECV